jgi:pimeloyl-ACP methyl ester carboxylesterase
MVGVALAAASAVAALGLFQGRLIYPAPHYRADALASLPPGLTALTDPAAPSSILGFYRAPVDGGAPQKLWLVFGGNGDLALRWDELIAPSATHGVGFLLVEYPGYGARAGTPSPESLLSGTEATLQALAQRLGVSTSELSSRSSVLGYSLGSAAALQYSALHPVRRIILFAPFTSMLDMARRVVGSPLCYLLTHRYDNVAALRAIQAKGLPPLTILHGAEDSLIPPRMGQALARVAPGSHFELVPGAEHGDVTDVAAPRLRSLLAEP